MAETARTQDATREYDTLLGRGIRESFVKYDMPYVEAGVTAPDGSQMILISFRFRDSPELRALMEREWAAYPVTD